MSVTSEHYAGESDPLREYLDLCLTSIALVRAGVTKTLPLGDPQDPNVRWINAANAAGIERSILEGHIARYPDLSPVKIKINSSDRL